MEFDFIEKLDRIEKKLDLLIADSPIIPIDQSFKSSGSPVKLFHSNRHIRHKLEQASKIRKQNDSSVA